MIVAYTYLASYSGSLMLAAAGRRDTAVPDPTGRLPEETLSAEALRLHFAAMGMSPQELVALSGAHTVCTENS